MAKLTGLKAADPFRGGTGALPINEATLTGVIDSSTV